MIKFRLYLVFTENRQNNEVTAKKEKITYK